MTQGELYCRFIDHMSAAGFEPHEYRGRWGYDGPAVTVDGPADFLAALRATDLPVCWDEMGKHGHVIYPGKPFRGAVPVLPWAAVKAIEDDGEARP